MGEKQFEFMLNLSDKLRTLWYPSEILETVASEAKKYFNGDICGCYEVQDGEIKGEYILKMNNYFRRDLGKDKWDELPIFKDMIENYQPIIVNNIYDDKLSDEEFRRICIPIGIESIFSIPVIKKGMVVGVFSVSKYKPYNWTKSDMKLAEVVAEQAWTAMERIRMVEERELLLSEVTAKNESLEAIINTVDIGIWTSDLQGNTILLNSNFVRNKGFSIEKEHVDEISIVELIKGLGIIRIDGKPMEEDSEFLHRIIKGETVKFEAILTTETGRVIYTESRATPQRDKDGNIIGVIGITQDITDRKEIEKSLRENRQKALELVEQLEKADKLRTDFLSSLSHELRNPLATIMMGLNLLKQIDGCGGEEETIEVMLRQGNQLTKLIDDLLDTTRIAQGKIPLQFENIELNILLNQILKDNSIRFKKKGILLESNIPTEKVIIKGEPVRLTQVIENLLHNAEKFTPKEGKVSVTLKEDDITNETVVSILDTGEGISAEILENIFEPFVQVRDNIGKSSAGLGLGLSIVKYIVKEHDGCIEVFSQGQGKGTEFIIRIPAL